MVKDRHTHSSKPPQNSRVSEHLSVDTRLAARAILDDERIGQVSRAPTTDQATRSQFLDWLERTKIKLTVGIVLVTFCVAVAPIWFEVTHRNRAVGLKEVVKAQAKTFVSQIGDEKMTRWFNNGTVDAFRREFKEFRPGLLEAITAKGLTVNLDDLGIRLDYEQKTILLGVKLKSDDGVSMTWASPGGDEPVRPLPSPSVGAVFNEHKDMLMLVGSVIVLCLAFIWFAPMLYRRRLDES